MPRNSDADLKVLSEDERERAARFIFEKDRQFFAACRATLRVLLQGYLDVAAADIVFSYSKRGKPKVTFETDVEFNVSHSGGVAVFAFARGVDIGVDVEKVKPIAELENIARRHFCAQECAQLIAQPEHERADAFFRCWTRKEAYIKATSDGLSAPLDQFQVTFLKDVECRFVHINGDEEEASRWALQNLELPAGFAGAVAYRGEKRKLIYFD
jgi:4'-phosphopantetheinyl transferase